MMFILKVFGSLIVIATFFAVFGGGAIYLLGPSRKKT